LTRISVVHQGALGDTILLIPLFQALRTHYGACSLTVVTRPNFGQMLSMLGFVDAYVSADDREHSQWFSPLEQDDVPNSRPAWADADHLLSAVSDGADDWAANARAFLGPRAVEGLHFFQPRPAPEYAGHVTQWHRDQLAWSGLSLEKPPLPLPRINPDGAVLIHPGSGGEPKCWPRERFLSLGRTLKRLGITPTFVLGEAEQERWGRKLIDELKDEFPWYLHMGLYELAEKMSRARLYLGNDSGVTHVAAAMGVPVIALFGPSSDAQWGPVGPAVKVLRAPAPHAHVLDALSEEAVLHDVLGELRKLG
jgi:ADP-heptose:LPS heptosyltransferase